VYIETVAIFTVVGVLFGCWYFNGDRTTFKCVSASVDIVPNPLEDKL
jgi:hypothetical protein